MIRELCRYPITALRAEALHYQGAAHGHHHERCLEDYGEITRFLLGLCFCRACADQAARHDVDVPALAARCRAYLVRRVRFGPRRPLPRRGLRPGHPPLPGRPHRHRHRPRPRRHRRGAQSGVRLTLLDETIPMQAYATGHGFDPARELVRAELALDPRALSQAGVHLEEPLYLAEPADADAALTWYRAQIGPDAPLSVVLRPGPPDTRTPGPRTPESLSEKAQLARSHNCTELNFYAYGLYRLSALDQIPPAAPTPNPPLTPAPPALAFSPSPRPSVLIRWWPFGWHQRGQNPRRIQGNCHGLPAARSAPHRHDPRRTRPRRRAITEFNCEGSGSL